MNYTLIGFAFLIITGLTITIGWDVMTDRTNGSAKRWIGFVFWALGLGAWIYVGYHATHYIQSQNRTLEQMAQGGNRNAALQICQQRRPAAFLLCMDKYPVEVLPSDLGRTGERE